MPGSRMALVGCATGAGGGWLVAGGSGPGGQAGPPTSQPAAHTAPADRPEDDQVQRHPRTHRRDHAGGHDPGRHDRRRPRSVQRRAHRQAGRPAAAHPEPGRGGLAPAAGRTHCARRGRRHPAATDRKPGRRALAPPDRGPGAVCQTGRAARLAHRLARIPGRGPRPGGWAGGARRHVARPQHPSRAVDLSTVRGHAARWGCRAHPAAPSPCPATGRSHSVLAVGMATPTCAIPGGR